MLELANFDVENCRKEEVLENQPNSLIPSAQQELFKILPKLKNNQIEEILNLGRNFLKENLVEKEREDGVKKMQAALLVGQVGAAGGKGTNECDISGLIRVLSGMQKR